MSVDISQIKAEIKEWQRAHRRIHGRDPGKEELRKNPEMQAKYKIWQTSLKAEKEKVNNAGNASVATTPPKRASKSIVPKTMPVQSTAGPATPFSARKIAPKLSPGSSSSSQPKIPNPFSQSPSKGPRPLDLSAAKARASSSKSTRTIPFDSASSARHRPFPILNSDSDEDDNPFAPTSPTRSRRPSSQLVSPSKSAPRRKSSGALLSHSTHMNPSPTRPKRPVGSTAVPAMTPRTKARKRMRGEEVPTTPGDKRRKLVPAIDSVPPPLFGEPRGTKRQSSDNDDDDEIMDSPRKKSAIGANGRVFTSVFDDTAGDEAEDGEELASPRKVTFAFSDPEPADDDVSGSLRSTPPPPPSESGESHAPDEDEDPADEDDDATPPPPTSTSTSRGKPLNPIIPSRWTQDKWDAPAPGTDLSHLRKSQFGKKPPAPDKSKGKAKGKSKQDKSQTTQDRIANPFQLLPPIPGDEPAPKTMRQADGRPKGKDARSGAEMKKRAKEVAAEAEMGQDESSEADEQVEEIVWRPHGPLRATTPNVSLPSSNPIASGNDEGLERADPAQNLPSDLRTLLSIHSTRQDDLKQEALARDLLAGRARTSTAVEVWGIGDLGDWEGEECDGEEGDWESEPEGWTGGVEM
ncbi:hypothetical protein FRC10_008257 [Ceratobasidium sp. 414]|nr:hypothetical protein FRC10_008257 [Ceratobasidium sp. 414]